MAFYVGDPVEGHLACRYLPHGFDYAIPHGDTPLTAALVQTIDVAAVRLPKRLICPASVVDEVGLAVRHIAFDFAAVIAEMMVRGDQPGLLLHRPVEEPFWRTDVRSVVANPSA